MPSTSLISLFFSCPKRQAHKRRNTKPGQIFGCKVRLMLLAYLSSRKTSHAFFINAQPKQHMQLKSTQQKSFSNKNDAFLRALRFYKGIEVLPCLS